MASPPYIFHDATLNITCRPMTATDSVVRCLPVNQGTISIYADAGCTTPAALFANQACETPTHIVVPSTSYNYCTGQYSSTTVYALTGAALATYYGKSGANCVAVAVPASELTYALGAVVPPSTFVAFTGP